MKQLLATAKASLTGLIDALGHWAFQVLIALDQFFNALLGGWADETLSARSFRAERSGKFFGTLSRPFIDTIFLVLTAGRETDHCASSYLSEQQRRHLHPAYRD